MPVADWQRDEGFDAAALVKELFDYYTSNADAPGRPPMQWRCVPRERVWECINHHPAAVCALVQRDPHGNQPMIALQRCTVSVDVDELGRAVLQATTAFPGDTRILEPPQPALPASSSAPTTVHNHQKKAARQLHALMSQASSEGLNAPLSFYIVVPPLQTLISQTRERLMAAFADGGTNGLFHLLPRSVHCMSQGERKQWIQAEMMRRVIASDSRASGVWNAMRDDVQGGRLVLVIHDECHSGGIVDNEMYAQVVAHPNVFVLHVSTTESLRLTSDSRDIPVVQMQPPETYQGLEFYCEDALKSDFVQHSRPRPFPDSSWLSNLWPLYAAVTPSHVLNEVTVRLVLDYAAAVLTQGGRVCNHRAATATIELANKYLMAHVPTDQVGHLVVAQLASDAAANLMGRVLHTCNTLTGNRFIVIVHTSDTAQHQLRSYADVGRVKGCNVLLIVVARTMKGCTLPPNFAALDVRALQPTALKGAIGCMFGYRQKPPLLLLRPSAARAVITVHSESNDVHRMCAVPEAAAPSCVTRYECRNGFILTGPPQVGKSGALVWLIQLLGESNGLPGVQHLC